jgi:cell division septal protein FtsQ
VLLTLAILGLPTVVYAWGRNSSSFDIATIRVAGAHLVPEKRALRLLRQDYAGRNLFAVTGGDVRETLAPLFFVSGASIDRDFPDTLAVTLTEYEPAAYALAGDRWYVVDREGYVICTAAEAADQLAGTARAPEPSPAPSSSAGAAAGARRRR